MSEKKQHPKGSIADFDERFAALAGEAKGYGLSVAWILLDSDPIAESNQPAWGWEGSPFTCESLARALADYISVLTDLVGYEAEDEDATEGE